MHARDSVSAEEAAALAACLHGTERHATGADVVSEGGRERVSRLLLEGIAARVKVLADGSQQITALHVPGDFVDLHSFTLKRLDHDVIALTPLRMGLFPHDALRAATEVHPHLGRMLWLLTMIDAAVHRAWIVSAGRLTALEQIGSLFCELYVRYDVVGLVDNGAYPLKITQHLLADACGLTPVHVNRILQELREIGLIQWRRGILEVRDLAGLIEISKFDPAYLNLIREPR